MADDINLVMPKLGLTMTEGTITEWRVQPGAAFNAGDIIVVVETEKIANEVEAAAAGVMGAHLVAGGQTVPVGTPIARWQPAAGGAVGKPAAAVSRPEAPAAAKPLSPPSPAPVKVAASRTPSGAAVTGQRIIATPLARRVAKEKGVDLRTVAGSGPGGRIKAADVTHAAQAPAAPATAPQTSYFLMTEVRAGELLDLRDKISKFEGMDTLTPAHFVCLAAARALRASPALTGSEAVNVAFSAGGAPAVTLGNAATLRLSDAVAGGDRHLAGSAAVAMTITDGGSQDATYLNAPLVPGQAAALGVGCLRASFRPDSQGRPVLVQEIGLVLTCDNGTFATAEGLTLLSAIKSYLESPLRLLVD